MTVKSNKIRNSAKGQECQVRLIGHCNGDSSTVIFAHYRMAGLSGVGQKPDDIFGAYCCSSCHDAVDGRVKTPLYSHDEIKKDFLEGVLRTQKILLDEGLINVL